LSGNIMTHLEETWLQEEEDPEVLLKEQATQTAMQVEGRNSIAELAERRAAERGDQSSEDAEDGINNDDFDDDVQVEYVRD
ncbi:MAG: hypothetical protein QMB64_03635, partial [Pseudomonadales bacterium]